MLVEGPAGCEIDSALENAQTVGVENVPVVTFYKYLGCMLRGTST